MENATWPRPSPVEMGRQSVDHLLLISLEGGDTNKNPPDHRRSDRFDRAGELCQIRCGKARVDGSPWPADYPSSAPRGGGVRSTPGNQGASPGVSFSLLRYMNCPSSNLIVGSLDPGPRVGVVPLRCVYYYTIPFSREQMQPRPGGVSPDSADFRKPLRL